MRKEDVEASWAANANWKPCLDQNVENTMRVLIERETNVPKSPSHNHSTRIKLESGIVCADSEQMLSQENARTPDLL